MNDVQHTRPISDRSVLSRQVSLKSISSSLELELGAPLPPLGLRPWLTVDLLHVDSQLHQAVRVAPLIVVPAHQLHEVVLKTLWTPSEGLPYPFSTH